MSAKGQIESRKKRIQRVLEKVTELSREQIKQATSKKGTVELEDILLNKSKFLNDLAIDLGVTRAKLEEYYDLWKTEGKFIEFDIFVLKEGKDGSTHGDFCLSDAYKQLPQNEQKRGLRYKF